MKFIKFIAIALLVGFVGCGGDGGDDPAPTPVERIPEKAALSFPNNNEECNTGVVLNNTQSLVNFSWSSATNATSYQLVIEDLISGAQIQQNTTLLNLDVTILMNTPYKWHVVALSTSSSQTAKSEEWRFYNSGLAITTYAPFPAAVVQPLMGSTLNETAVNLQWDTADVDGDLDVFEVYFGTVNPPVDVIGTVSDSFLNNVAVSPNTYYWFVKSFDKEGNTSNSEVFEFKISN